jgi:pimeloyl-ACP methyl ester carboxylesterase
MLQLPTARANVSKTHAPTLTIVGDADFIMPPSQARILHAGIPQSELMMIEHYGHFLYVDQSGAVIPAICDWLGRELG